MEVSIVGSGQNENFEAQVDPTHRGLRVSPRPLEHVVGEVVGGHYGVVAATGLLAIQTAASSALFAVRFVSSTKLMVLLKLVVGFNVTTVYSAATDGGEPDFELYLSRSYLTSPSGGGTALAPASIAQIARANMAPSEFCSNGAILPAGTGALTTGTPTLDSAPYSYATLSQPGRALGSLGTAELVNIYRTGEHPIVLNTNQGFVIRNTRQLAGAAGTGVGRATFAMEWAEVAAY